MIVTQIPTENFTSNVYKINLDNDVWFIDMGNAKPCLNLLLPNENVKGIFITNSHYDHIIGINEFCTSHQGCKIYASEYAKAGLFSEKLNLSYYHDDPFVLSGQIVNVINDNDIVELSFGYNIKCFYTPGHNEGSMCYKLNQYLFTGDSYIPGSPVVTKLKSGNKQQSESSLKIIKSLIGPETIICPGHKNMVCGIV